MASVAPERRHRLTVGDFFRMGEVGILAPGARVELIDGEIIDMAPIGSFHAGTVARLCRLLGDAVGDRAIVWPQNPIVLGNHSAPQPDVTLLRPRSDFYTTRHPGPEDVILAIEVADTTLRDDREIKAPLYATHSIPEYWVVDLGSRCVYVFRRPQDTAYRDAFLLATPGVLSPQGLSEVRIDLDALFPA